jgi:hypothetical protein
METGRKQALLQECYNRLKRREEIRENLILLKKELKEPQGMLLWKQISGGDADSIMRCLSDQDPKVRKNAAQILGALRVADAVDVLMDAYEAEDRRFVRPAYLQALRGMDCSEYLPDLKKRLKELTEQPAAADEKKHLREEIHALAELLQSQEGAGHRFQGYGQTHRVFLKTEHPFVKGVADRITEKHKVMKSGVLTETAQLKELMQIRSVDEFLFLLTVRKLPADLADLAKELMEEGLGTFLEKNHSGTGPFCFRIEMLGVADPEEKRRLVKEAAEKLEEASRFFLINSPSGYEVEIRLIRGQDRRWVSFLKLYTMEDSRFRYRRGWVAAGMQPHVAAGLLDLAQPWLKEHAQVLDPFCGAGIWLIERNYRSPSRSAYGIDTFGEAIDKARINAETAHMPIHFVHRDFFDFRHEYLFDEILADMPEIAGATRETLDQFYERFFRKAKTHLTEDGIILCYSREMGRIKKQLRIQKEYRLIAEYEINARSGRYFFVIGRRKGNGGQQQERH